MGWIGRSTTSVAQRGVLDAAVHTLAVTLAVNDPSVWNTRRLRPGSRPLMSKRGRLAGGHGPMRPVDPADPIVTAVIPICDVLARLVGVIEHLSGRIDVLELEAIYRCEKSPSDSPERKPLGQ